MADLSVTKTDGSVDYIPGGSTTYTIVVANNGPSAVTGATLTDTLPVAITSATWTVSYTGTGSGGPTSGSGNISASVNLAVGGTATFTVVATISSTATDILVNTAGVAVPAGTTDPNDANNSATVTLTPQLADLALQKDVEVGWQIIDTNVTFTFRINNLGPDAATNVVVQDPFPDGLTFVSAANPSQGTFDPSTNTWFVGTLANGTSASLQIVARIAQLGPISNTAQVGEDQIDPDLSNNRSTATVTGMRSAAMVSKAFFLASSDSLDDPVTDPSNSSSATSGITTVTAPFDAVGTNSSNSTTTTTSSATGNPTNTPPNATNALAPVSSSNTNSALNLSQSGPTGMGDANPTINPGDNGVNEDLLSNLGRNAIGSLVFQFITTPHPIDSIKQEQTGDAYVSWNTALDLGMDRINFEQRLREFTDSWTSWAESDDGWDAFWSVDLPTLISDHDDTRCGEGFRSRLQDEVGLWLLTIGMLDRWGQDGLANEEYSRNRKRLQMAL
jgi:uncharacterized repeat protein (TIGR01451 family)